MSGIRTCVSWKSFESIRIECMKRLLNFNRTSRSSFIFLAISDIVSLSTAKYTSLPLSSRLMRIGVLSTTLKPFVQVCGWWPPKVQLRQRSDGGFFSTTTISSSGYLNWSNIVWNMVFDLHRGQSKCR